jgi:hypothetical protein
MVRTTRAQRVALQNVYQRLCREHYRNTGDPKGPESYLSFRRKVVPGPGCIMIPYAGMWLGIEPDGYTHS